MDESYINKNSTGTEVMNGSLDILQKLLVRGKVKILGDFITSGESTKDNAKQMPTIILGVISLTLAISKFFGK